MSEMIRAPYRNNQRQDCRIGTTPKHQHRLSWLAGDSWQSPHRAKVVPLPLLQRARDDTVVCFRADGTARSYVKVIGAVSSSVGCVAIECSTK